MWRCPKCGRLFANPNQWHSCGSFDAQTLLSSGDPKAVQLYRQFERMVRKYGPVTVSPVKTSIGFKVRTTFAAVKFQKNKLRIGILLGRRLENSRFVKVLSVSPRSHEHVFLVRDLRDLDEEVQAWLQEAYRVGQRFRVKRN